MPPQLGHTLPLSFSQDKIAVFKQRQKGARTAVIEGTGQMSVNEEEENENQSKYNPKYRKNFTEKIKWNNGRVAKKYYNKNKFQKRGERERRRGQENFKNKAKKYPGKKPN